MAKTVCALPLLLVLASCSLFDQSDYISKHHKSSGCGGFLELSKVAAIPDSLDSADYCSAEKLRWSYQEGTGVLELLLTRNLQNCAAKPEMNVTTSNDRLVIAMRDTNDPKVRAHCLCYFDLYCEVPAQSADTVTIEYQDILYGIDLTQGHGTVVVDTSTGWPCP